MPKTFPLGRAVNVVECIKGLFWIKIMFEKYERRIVDELDALQAEVDALKRLPAETAAELDALLDRAFKGEL
jgi:hypothetical protein